MDLCNIGVIKDVLGRNGFRFSKSMGQNFLTEAWVPERIADEAGLDGGVCVLEVGPGIGCLTVQLAGRAGKVVSIELDRALEPVLKETLAGYDNTEVVFGDALKIDLPALVREKFGDARTVVCANLPYNVTTPLLTAFFEAGCFESITVMVQREVARRLCASAGTSDYGAFTVFTQWHCRPEILFDVSPGCFMPMPKVTSSVIRLDMRTAPPVQVKSEALFFRTVRAAFNQRRKTLTNALTAGFGEFSKGELESVVVACGLDARVRGEALDMDAFARVADGIYALRSFGKDDG